MPRRSTRVRPLLHRKATVDTSAPRTSPSTPPASAAHSTPEGGSLRRTLKSRHLTMIAMGGAIGTGLFVASGNTIATAGPVAPSWPTWPSASWCSC